MHALQLQVVAEVYAAQNVVVKPQILLSLVLYKIVDPAQVVQHPMTVSCCNPVPAVWLHVIVVYALFIFRFGFDWPQWLPQYPNLAHGLHENAKSGLKRLDACRTCVMTHCTCWMCCLAASGRTHSKAQKQQQQSALQQMVSRVVRKASPRWLLSSVTCRTRISSSSTSCQPS